MASHPLADLLRVVDSDTRHNNLPTDVMREEVERGIVVGSNVVPTRLGERTHPSRYRLGPSASGFRVLLGRIGLAPPVRAPGLLSVLTRSTEIGSAWRARSASFRRHADLLVVAPSPQAAVGLP